MAVLVVAGLAALFFLAGCSGQTDPATNVTTNSATLHGHVACPPGDGSVSFWWRWRKDTGPWQESSHASTPCEGLDNDVDTQYQLSGLEPGSHYQFEGCSQPGDYPFCVNADGMAGIVVPGQDGPGEPIDSFDTKSPSDLVPVDGGPNYYGQFSNSLPDDPNYFPIMAWLRKAEQQSQIDAYVDFGLNGLVGVENPEGTQENLLRKAGLHVIIQAGERTRFNDLGSETAGWFLDDEVDMCCGPPGFDGGNGYQMLAAVRAGLPQDNRLRYNNYGKGVMFWESDSDAARFINDYQDVVANDIYWFTDPNERTRPGYRIAASYGTTVDRMRYLDSLDGKRQPVWNVVELGWPFTDSASQGGRRIQPAELRAAVWQSIIAGARGIVYFDHNFGPGTPESTVLGQGYADNRAMAKSVNAQITALAPVLNSPSDPSYVTTSPGIRTMAKLYNGTHYVFAGSSDGNGHDATFTVPSGTVATVEGENRTIPITNGSFTDNFADGNAIHIYRIDD